MNPARVDAIKAILPRTMLADWVRLGSRLARLLKDTRHTGHHEEMLDRLWAEALASRDRRARRAATPLTFDYPADLPITARKDEIVDALRNHPVVVIAGETGSGKTTQLPKMCLEAGLGIEALVGCTQPRRVAALSISRRLAEELHVEWGQEVGCKIRFDDRSTERTRVKLMTDGILLAEVQSDPQLSQYNAVIIDEAHERSLNIDFLLGWLLQLSTQRPDLRIIITSATIDTGAFSRAFNNAPVIEVSGRAYPVEVRHAPPAPAEEEEDAPELVEAAIAAVRQILSESSQGDILVFMPGEREIREMQEALQARREEPLEIVPLYARLSAGEQERAFAPSLSRKVILATNIAETSLTLPGIRYVVDSGLARISRYNPRTRTRRLPIEPVSQSSANQRRGRAGRVQAGVCIRLYSEDDFAARPEFTQPEIQRSNLAEVILRMRTFSLGRIETFPFLNPPSPSAIDGGYKLLQELGALDDQRELTPLGRRLGRLPIDPTLGRMLLQALEERATREVLILACGLSIQDPRERPHAQKEAAEAAHRRWTDARSDFMSFLVLWEKIDEAWKGFRSQRERRKFCKAHFISYTRVVEWRDLHQQLLEILRDQEPWNENEARAEHEAVHRCVLAGFAGQVARRLDKNRYQTAAGKEAILFPGSALYDRTLALSGPARGHGQPATRTKSRQPEWIVAGEMVETSQLFLRSAGAIDPNWIMAVAPHLCRSEYVNPHWSPEAGKVLAEQVVRLNGLELFRRKAAYENIAPEKARDLFVRHALVEEQWESPSSRQARGSLVARRNPTQHQLLEASEEADPAPRSGPPFLEHNRSIRHRIETWQTRVRRHDLGDLDEALFQFYRSRLPVLSSRHALLKWLREEGRGSILQATVEDVAGDLALDFDTEAFPDEVSLAGEMLRASYAYAPGEAHDGATLSVPFSLASALSGSQLSWAIPGQRREIAMEYLRALPKALRKELMPLAAKAEAIASELQPSKGTLAAELAQFLWKRFGVRVAPEAWDAEAIPPHLRPRVEVVDASGKVLGAGRVWETLQTAASRETVASGGEGRIDHDPWPQAVARWERHDLKAWTVGDLPEVMEIGIAHGRALKAWPGFEWEQGVLSLRMFRSADLARASTERALPSMMERELQKDLAWSRQDLRALEPSRHFLAGWISMDQLQEDAWDWLKRLVTSGRSLPALRQRAFIELAAAARAQLRTETSGLPRRINEILRARSETLAVLRRVAGAREDPGRPKRVLRDFSQLESPRSAVETRHPLRGDLDSLVPGDFLRHYSREELDHLPRYVKALQVRAERAALNPAKDAERALLVEPWERLLTRVALEATGNPSRRIPVETFRRLIFEYRVSVFAQELGTSIPVSPKRLHEAHLHLFQP